MAAGVKKIGAWKRLRAMLTPSILNKKLKREVRVATGVNAQFVMAQVQKGIQSGVDPANRPLTMMVKQAGKPLVDTAALFNAITFRMMNYKTAFVGVLRTNDAANVAEAVHEGVTFKVSAAMRMLFRYLYWASVTGDPSKLTGRAVELWNLHPGGWYPLKASTDKIKVPARPFLRKVFNDPAVLDFVAEQWRQAVLRAAGAV